MTARFVRSILLMLLFVTAACQPKLERKAEKIAREQMTPIMGAEAVGRSEIEVRPSQAGWMVIFRDANASCEEGSWWPGACRFGNRVFRDVYACVEWDWDISQMGYSGESEVLGEEDLCPAPAPERPTLEPNP